MIIAFPQDGRTAFMWAAESADVDTLEKFLDVNVDSGSLEKVLT